MLILATILSLFYSIIGQSSEDLYNQLVSELVSEEHCQIIISNLTALIDQGYIYLDFLKEPKQPDGYPNYTSKVDLISELNNIEKNNRTFYGFYRDIFNVLNKAKDSHLDMFILSTPKILIYFYQVFVFHFIIELFLL